MKPKRPKRCKVCKKIITEKNKSNLCSFHVHQKYQKDCEKNKREIKRKTKFKEDCICLWSKDNKYGFLPFTDCPVHGKDAKRLIKNSVEVKI